jgi:hypothetical protein
VKVPTNEVNTLRWAYDGHRSPFPTALSRLPQLLMLVLCLAVDGSGTGTASGQTPSREPVQGRAALDKLVNDDLRRISVHQLNLFHLHFVEVCLEREEAEEEDRLPREVRIRYLGPLKSATTVQKSKVSGSNIIGRTALSWVLYREFRADPRVIGQTDDQIAEANRGAQNPIFEFWISTQQTRSTIKTCRIEGKQMFVNVESVIRKETVDQPLQELGGRSVRSVLAWLTDRPPGEADAEPDDLIVRESLRRISVYQLSQVHLLFLENCIVRQKLPNRIGVHYEGTPGTIDSPRKLKLVNAGIGDRLALTWSVGHDLVVFRFWISTKETEETITSCRIDDVELFVNVSFVMEGLPVEANLEDLGNQSVRRVLSRLTNPGI